MKTTRRDLLLGSAAAGAALPLLRSPQLLAKSPVAEDRILVVLQLQGGNDWLNTVIPAGNARYQAARPTLQVAPQVGLPCGTSVNGNLYFHPAMTAFKRLWDAGKLAVVSGVGYPNHNYSHFRSEDVWYTADPLATSVSSGWLGRYFRDVYAGGFTIPALLAQTGGNNSFVGFGVPSITNPSLFAFGTDPYSSGIDGQLERTLVLNHARALRPAAHPSLLHGATGIDRAINNSALLQQTGTAYVPRATYPDPATNPLTTPFRLIARYITGGSTTPGSGLDTRCYYLSTGGFDSHAAQGGATGNHATLLERFTSAIEAFLADLVAWGHGHRVVVMVWSEFTRRFGENGSGGTDHGNSGGVFVCGDSVVGGHYGSYPDINAMTPPYTSRNLDPTTDLRDVYSTLLSRWWGADPRQVIARWTPSALGFLA
jgi:uncharacterized protein (DUF1501 family)